MDSSLTTTGVSKIFKRLIKLSASTKIACVANAKMMCILEWTCTAEVPMEEASSTPMSLWTPLTKRVPSHLPSTGLASYKKTQAVSRTVDLLELRRSASGPDAPIRS